MEVVIWEVSLGFAVDRKFNGVLVIKWFKKILENGKEIYF